MAKYRHLHTKFWIDPFIEELTAEQKYFYIYILTNPSTSQCGIYEITINTISHQSGIKNETIKKLLTFFEEKRKIKYAISTSELCLINFRKYNWTTSPKVISCIKKEIKEVKNKALVDLIYGIDTLSQEKQKEKEEGDMDFYPLNINSKHFNDAIKICDFFGFKFETNPDKFKICITFLEDIEKQNKMDLFKERFDAYIKYKKISGEKTHNLVSFLGTKPQNFLDGGWNANNWTKKLESISKINKSILLPGQNISTDLKYKKWN